MRPIAACAMEVVERTRVSQVTPVTPSIPRAMVYGLYRALPGEPGFLAPVTPEKLASQELDTSVGVSGPHDFAVRLSAVRYRRFRVHRIPPRVRDDREPPLQSEDRNFPAKLAQNTRRDREAVSTKERSCPDLIRASIHLREERFRRGWIAGSSPAMTKLGCLKREGGTPACRPCESRDP